MKKNHILLLIYLVIIVSFIFIVTNALKTVYKQEFFTDSSKNISYMAKIEGKDLYIYDGENKWSDFFVSGVNIGLGSPGYFPGEFAITKESYKRWFNYIQDMNVNTIRVYVPQMPHFYEALYEHNKYAEKKLYLIQGVYMNEEEIDKYHDAFSEQSFLKSEFFQNIKNSIDAIHGNASIEKKPGHASGIYTVDVSEYVIGYILGVEWDPYFVINTNDVHSYKETFEGKYVYTKNASPFEIFLAETAETAISYETEKYNIQRPVSISNWVTTDPVSHPNEPDEYEDMVSVDVEHILKKDTFIPGFFASYHIYPYHPEIFSYEPKYIVEGSNTYKEYLKDLNKHHSIPVLVAEYGIPTSRGLTHINTLSGFNQGNTNEKEQGHELVSLFKDIYDTNCMGGIIFSWQDEWFKKAWNTTELIDSEKRPFYFDYQTCEKNFGILSFDVGDEDANNFCDGNFDEWSNDDLVSSTDKHNLYVKSDEGFIYIMAEGIDPNKDKIIIPIDTVLGQGNYKYNNLSFEKAADFIICIDGKEHSSVYIDAYYDYMYTFFRNITDLFDEHKEAYTTKNSGIFVKRQMCLTKPFKLPLTGEEVPFTAFDTGKLKYGINNPESKDFNSLADFYFSEDKVEIRIPWVLLNVMDPSTGKVIADMRENDSVNPLTMRSFYFGIADLNTENKIKMDEYELKTWETPKYHERLKQSYYILKDYFASYSFRKPVNS